MGLSHLVRPKKTEKINKKSLKTSEKLANETVIG